MDLHSTRLTSVTVVAEPLANQDAATALDIAFVYDAAAAKALPAASPEWFKKKEALLELFPTSIEVVSLEIQPATVSRPALPRRSTHAVRVIAYAAYGPAAGQHACDLTQFRSPVVTLAPEFVAISDK
jgi:hypothetical protein